MTTANDGYTGGAGGKLRNKKASRKTTPYDRPSIGITNPSNNNTSKSGFFSRLLYAGADRVLGAFWKRNKALTQAPVIGTNEEQKNELQEEGPSFGLKTNTGASEPNTNEGGNLANISAATEISDLETLLKEKTFTRSELERLTALVRSRTTTSDVGEGDKANISNTSHVLRLEASTSGLNKHVEERDNFHAVKSTPVIDSRAFEEDVASPAELAKAYMGTRPAKISPSTLMLGSQAPRQDSVLLNNTTILPRTPMTSLVPRTAGILKGSENGMTTPRSRGRSAMYSMARSPYYRGPSTLGKKPTPSLISSQPAWEEQSNGSKMAGKRRSSVLDDLGSGGPMRRIRQKANLYSSKHKSEFDSSGQKLLLSSEPEQKASKAIVENGETSKRDSGYAFVPTESTQMASRIFEHLERMSPKEKPSSSRFAGTTEKSATKLTSNLAPGSLDKVESSKFLLSSQNNQKSEGQPRTEDNGSKRFAVPLNVLSSMNGNSTAPVLSNAPTTNADSTLALPAEPPQKKHAFKISADEDSQVLDDDNHSNGHASISLGENAEPRTTLLVNNNVSVVAPTEVSQTPAATSKIVSPSKTVNGSPGGSLVDKQKVGNNLQASPAASSSYPQSTGISQSVSIADTASPQKRPTILPTILPTYDTSTKSAEEVSPFSFAVKGISNVKQDISSTNNSSITNGTATHSPTAANTVLPSPAPAAASSTLAIVSPSVAKAPDTSATKDKEPISNIFSSSTFSSTSVSSPPATTLTTNGQVFGLPTNTQAPTVIPSSTSSAPFSFGLTPSTTSSPVVFNAGASTASSVFAFNAASATNQFSQAPFGTPAASLNNNDQRSMEDSMREDSPSPAIPAIAPASAGTPTFAFNSGTPTPSPSTSPFQFGVQNNQPPSTSPFQFGVQNNQPPSTSPFQFGVQNNQPPSQNPFQVQTNQPPSQNPFQLQTNQPPSQNPFQVQTNQPPSQNLFQASGSLESHAGGSFSLGTGGGDKSNRRMVKPSRIKNRRKENL